MKGILLALLLIISVGRSSAQYKTARVNTDELISRVYPEFASEFLAFQEHIDNLYNDLEQDEKIKGYLQTIQDNDSSSEEAQIELLTAQQEITQIQNRMSDLSQQIYLERFGERLSRLNELVTAYQSENALDLIFDFSSQGMGEIRFLSQELQNAIEKTLGDCVAMPEGLDADQYRTELDKRLPPCQEKILKPLLDQSMDVTDLIIQSLQD